jgi:hypothetical protein
LQGELPDEVAALKYIQVLNLFDNSVGGTIPSGLGSLAELRLLDVEQNALTGRAFVDLSGAVAIESYGNGLVGTIPSTIGALPNLGTLDAGGILPRSLNCSKALTPATNLDCSTHRVPLLVQQQPHGNYPRPRANKLEATAASLQHAHRLHSERLVLQHRLAGDPVG